MMNSLPPNIFLILLLLGRHRKTSQVVLAATDMDGLIRLVEILKAISLIPLPMLRLLSPKAQGCQNF